MSVPLYLVSELIYNCVSNNSILNSIIYIQAFNVSELVSCMLNKYKLQSWHRPMTPPWNIVMLDILYCRLEHFKMNSIMMVLFVLLQITLLYTTGSAIPKGLTKNETPGRAKSVCYLCSQLYCFVGLRSVLFQLGKKGIMLISLFVIFLSLSHRISSSP